MRVGVQHEVGLEKGSRQVLWMSQRLPEQNCNENCCFDSCLLRRELLELPGLIGVEQRMDSCVPNLVFLTQTAFGAHISRALQLFFNKHFRSCDVWPRS